MARTIEHLILLDIDGTLTNTFDIDGDCFVQAIGEVFAFTNVCADWSKYPDATDSGIVHHLCQDRIGREPAELELEQMESCFHSRLANAFTADSSACQPIAGGPDFVNALIDRDNVAVALATGGWERTARLKLNSAGYVSDDIPMASANDSRHRTEICSIALHRSMVHYQATRFETITYIGDGIWDARASAELGYRFIARSAETDRFTTLGAAMVVVNFSSPDLAERICTVGS